MSMESKRKLSFIPVLFSRSSGVKIAIASVAASSILSLGIVPAQADPLPAPEVKLTDENGVDLAVYAVSHSVNDLSIGSGWGALSHTRFISLALLALGQDADNFEVLMKAANQQHTPSGFDGSISVVANGTSDIFNYTGNIWTGQYTAKIPGSTLVYNGDDTYDYTLRDGTVHQITTTKLIETVFPNGLIRTYHYDSQISSLLRSVVQNNGLQIKYNGSNPLTSGSLSAVNNAYEYCDPSTTFCSLSQSWPTVNYSYTVSLGDGTFTITHVGGETTRFTYDNYQLSGVKFAINSGTTDNITYEHCNEYEQNCFSVSAGGTESGGPMLLSQNVTDMTVSATKDGQTTNYTYTQSQYVTEYQSDGGPLGQSFTVLRDTAYGNDGRFVWVRPPGPVDYINYDPNVANRVTSVVMAEGDATYYRYDARGNIIKIIEVPKTGGISNPDNCDHTDYPTCILREANYDTTCTNTKTCNKPNWVSDGRGNKTYYYYHAQSGMVEKVVSPADETGNKPERRYSYAQRYAWVKNSSGNYVQAADPIWVLTEEEYCRTSSHNGSACTAGASDLVVISYDYGPNSGPNNLFLRGKAVTAEGQTLRTCYKYDALGNVISETAPRADLTSCP